MIEMFIGDIKVEFENARLWTTNICKAATWATYREALNYMQGCYLRTIPECKVVCIEIHEIEEVNK